jgi:hypothetical protein
MAGPADAGPEVARAEARGAEAVRAQLRELLDTQRRVVRVGEAQVEVVEAQHLERLLQERFGSN